MHAATTNNMIQAIISDTKLMQQKFNVIIFVDSREYRNKEQTKFTWILKNTANLWVKTR